MIERHLIPAEQVVKCAPWQIPLDALESEAVKQAAGKIKNRMRALQTGASSDQPVLFSAS